MLQLEFPSGPLILRLLCQEVDGDVTVGDRRGVGWPVVLTQYLGSGGACQGCPLLYPVPTTPSHVFGPCHSNEILFFASTQM